VYVFSFRYFIPQDADRAERVGDTGRGALGYSGTGSGIGIDTGAGGTIDCAGDSEGDGDSSDSEDDVAPTGPQMPPSIGIGRLQHLHLFQSDACYKNTYEFVHTLTATTDRVFVRGRGPRGTSSTGDRSHHSARTNYLLYSERKLVSFVPGSGNLKTSSGPMPSAAARADDQVTKPFIVETSEVRRVLPLVLLCGGDFRIRQAAAYAGVQLRSGDGGPNESDGVDITDALLAPLATGFAGLTDVGVAGASSLVSKALGQHRLTPAVIPVSLPGAGAGTSAVASSVGQMDQIPPSQRVLIVIDKFCVFSTDIHTATLLLFVRVLLQVILHPPGAVGGASGQPRALAMALDRVIELILTEV